MDQSAPEICEPTLWRKAGWTAKIIKNEDDDGWAVSMTAEGESEPSLVGPWTMGRDKKNPKPLDQTAFTALVKGANDVMTRHANAARALLHRSLSFMRSGGQRIRADLDIVPDEDDPHAILAVFNDATGESLFRQRVDPRYRLVAERIEALLGEE